MEYIPNIRFIVIVCDWQVYCEPKLLRFEIFVKFDFCEIIDPVVS